MAAARSLRVKGVDGATLERRTGVFDEPGLVERVGVDRHLHVHQVGDRKAAVDGRRRRPPVLVQLQATGARPNLLVQGVRQRGVALAEEAQVHGQAIRRLQHAADVPRAGRAGRGVGAVRRAGAAAEHRGEAGIKGVLHQLRADPVDVRIDAAGGDDASFTGDGLGAGADHDVDAGLDVRVAGLADADDAAVAEPDVGLDDAPVVDDQGVGDHRVDGAVGAGDLGLPHAVADHLATAELDLLAIDRPVFLDLDDQVGVGEADPIADRGAEHAGVGGALDAKGHGVSPPAGP